MKELYKDVVTGADLALIRQVYGVQTQEEFGARVERTRQTVSNWETAPELPKKIIESIEEKTGWQVQRIAAIFHEVREQLENEQNQSESPENQVSESETGIS